MTGKISEDTLLNVGDFDGTEDTPVVKAGVNYRMKAADLAGLAPVLLSLPASRAASPIATNSNIANFRVPFDCTLEALEIYMNVAPNAAVTFDLSLDTLAGTIFTTKPTIDSGEKTTQSAATPYVTLVTPMPLFEGEELTFSIPTFSGSAGSGVTLQGLLRPFFGTRLIDSGDNGTGTTRLLFKFDSNLNDSSVNTFSHSTNGTVNLVSLGTGVSIGTDVMGAQFHNTGDTDEISVTQTFNWAAAFTIDAWIILADGTGTGIAAGPSGLSGFFIESNLLEGFHYNVGTTNINFFADTIPIPDNTPTHVALTHDGSGTFKLWVGGEERASHTFVGTVPANEGSIFVGSGGGFYSFNGVIAQWRWSTGQRWTSNFLPPTNFN